MCIRDRVRYDGLAGHRLLLELRERDTEIGKIHFLRLRHDSPSLNVYSNRPHLKHKRFHQFYGLYPEGLKLGETETHFAHRVKDKLRDGPWIVALSSGVENSFRHIGVSRQGTELDVAAS